MDAENKPEQLPSLYDKANDAVRMDSFCELDDAVMVADGGDFVATASYILRPRSPLAWLDPGAFGTLGVGACFALGAGFVRPPSEISHRSASSGTGSWWSSRPTRTVEDLVRDGMHGARRADRRVERAGIGRHGHTFCYVGMLLVLFG